MSAILVPLTQASGITPPSVEASAAGAGEDAKKKKKKKDKVRSAWISFVGRILAQMVGAAATIALGLLVVDRYHKAATAEPAEAAVVSAASAARPSTPRMPGEKTIAVLPLQNYSAGAEDEHFADAMTEALIAHLAQVKGFRVISRTSSMHYKGQRTPLREIARELNVDLIVEGSVVKTARQVRVTAQLIDAATDEHLWARSYDRSMRDVLGLQAEVVTTIVRELRAALGLHDVARVRLRARDNGGDEGNGVQNEATK